MKFLYSSLLMTLILAQVSKMALAEENSLTEAQKTKLECLESKLGKPGSKSRPSREAFEAAMTACKIEKGDLPPPRHHGGHRPPPPNNSNSNTGEDNSSQTQEGAQ